MEWIAEQTVAPPEDLARLAMTGGRRAYGDGSIYQRADGRWVGVLVLPGRRRRVFYAKGARTFDGT